MVVVGYRTVDFEDKQTGKQISGYTFYSIENDGSCIGRIAFKDFVPGSLPEVVSAFVYDRKGAKSNDGKRFAYDRQQLHAHSIFGQGLRTFRHRRRKNL